MEKTEMRKRLLPFALTAGIIALDQATKALVVANIRLGSRAWSFMGDFFWLIHVRNKGIALSIGDGFPDILRYILFIIIPLGLIVAAAVYLVRTDRLSAFQRWTVAGLIGGGIGTILDRVFRADGVVDFLSFKFWGILGWERFPTFNVSDSAVTVCALLLVASSFSASERGRA